MIRKTAIFFLFLLFAFPQIGRADKVWQAQNSGIGDPDIRSISVFHKDDKFICTASPKVVYFSQDSGKLWQKIFSLEVETDEINFATFDFNNPKTLYLATTKGLLVTENNGNDWRVIFRRVGETVNNVRWITLDSLDRQKIYIGTDEGLYVSQNLGLSWQEVSGGLPHSQIRSVVVHPNNSQVLYLANTYGLFKSIDGAKSWKRIYLTSHKLTDDEQDEDYSEEDENQNLINCVAIDKLNPKRIFIATGQGVLISQDAGESWKKVLSQGLSSDYVNFVVIPSDKKDRVYAATKGGVFEFSSGLNRWQGIYQGMVACDVRCLALNMSEKQLFAGTDRGIFKTIEVKNVQIPKQEEKEIVKENKIDFEQVLKELSANEPTIREVQETALRYAEVVHPDKIKALRRDAKLKALLPKFSVGADRNVTDLYHWEGGSTTTVDDDFLRKGKDIIEWDASLTWDLGDLVFSEQVRLIDSNTRLMVQLRDDILNEVTRLYYERRKLQTEFILAPPEVLEEKLTKTLRLEELTANIDALTGGWFSRQLEKM
ncbi:MAG: hypothetical protein ISS43_02885 [Candidatus Omnitrophica bacterium]|nr:hypothetical protein [Candidatus Omnitrophota bacterium]